MSKAQNVNLQHSVGVPSITSVSLKIRICKIIANKAKDDLLAFFEAHFSQDALSSFSGTFINPSTEQEIQDDEWDEDDGLGYYDDGVKRTLTDEQIEIFRHSELEELRKRQEKAANGKQPAPSDEATPAQSPQSSLPQSFRNTNRRKKKAKKVTKREPKPDLRKRTWDVVDKGLDSLDYD